MDDTLVIPKLEPSRPARQRRITTQFAPERRAARWPWLVALAAFIALAISVDPWDPIREQRLETQADKVLPLLP